MILETKIIEVQSFSFDQIKHCFNFINIAINQTL